jgi:hypothetical protein
VKRKLDLAERAMYAHQEAKDRQRKEEKELLLAWRKDQGGG